MGCHVKNEREIKNVGTLNYRGDAALSALISLSQREHNPTAKLPSYVHSWTCNPHLEYGRRWSQFPFNITRTVNYTYPDKHELVPKTPLLLRCRW